MYNPGTELAALPFGNLIGGPLQAVITAQSDAAEATTEFIKNVGFYPDGTTLDGKDVGNTPVYVDFKYPKEIAPFQQGETTYSVASIRVADGGNGYAVNDNIILSVASGETAATAKVSEIGDGGAITKIEISTPGSYLNPPTITDVEGNGTNADLIVEMNTDGTSNSQAAIYQDMKFSVPLLTMVPIPFIKIDTMTVDFNAKITSMTSRQVDNSFEANLAFGYEKKTKKKKVEFSASTAFKRTATSGSSIEKTYSMAVHVKASQDEMPAGMEKLLGILEGAIISTPALAS